jgi:hypothetical protein
MLDYTDESERSLWLGLPEFLPCPCKGTQDDECDFTGQVDNPDHPMNWTPDDPRHKV